MLPYNMIYILLSCNKRKERSSISCVIATPIFNELIKTIVRKIKDGEMNYRRGSDNLPIKKQVSLFYNDLDTEKLETLSKNLEYGCIRIISCENDEEIIG